MKLFNFLKKKKGIENLLKNADKNIIFCDILLLLEDKCSYGKNIELLSKPELYVLVFREFIEEVMNGGFEQYLGNSSGDNFNYLIESLKAIEAYDVLNIYENTLKLIPKLPTDRDKRYDVVDEILTDDLINKLSKCDKEFFKIDQAYFEDIVYKYVMSNKEYFNS